MKENLFEMGADLGDGWESDNKKAPAKKEKTEIKPPQKHQLYLAKEKRRGKVVTIVKPFHLSKTELQALLKSLKKRLGTGGTLKEDALEFQGDIPDKLQNALEEMHYRFRV
jgi:translation initiation factor 1